jgi:hypothetical protein
MFAFSRDAVDALNIQSRAALQQKKLLGQGSVKWVRMNEDTSKALQVNDTVITRFADRKSGLLIGEIAQIKALNEKSFVLDINGKAFTILNAHLQALSKIDYSDIHLRVGERILFRRNNKELEVRNGDMAFIESINATQITARLDSGQRVTIPRSYQHIDYGYATTVHKGQGMTVDHAKILIDSHYWDSNLSFVAMTRHRNSLAIYADKHQHPDLEALKTTLSRKTTKDNVIDWPLDFAIRAGFNPDKMVGRALNHIAGVKHQIKNKWNYIVNYENYLKHQALETKQAEQRALRTIAKEVACYMDDKSALTQQLQQLEKEAAKQEIDKSTLPEFKTLSEQQHRLPKRAYELLTTHGEQLEKLVDKKSVGLLKKDAEGYDKKRLREKYEALKLDNPLLRQYEALQEQRRFKTGYLGERIDKQLEALRQTLQKNQKLMTELGMCSPKWVKQLEYQRNKSKEALEQER